MHARTILLNHLNFCRATFQLCKHVPCINLTDAVLLIIDDLMTIKGLAIFTLYQFSLDAELFI